MSSLFSFFFLLLRPVSLLFCLPIPSSAFSSFLNNPVSFAIIHLNVAPSQTFDCRIHHHYRFSITFFHFRILLSFSSYFSSSFFTFAIFSFQPSFSLFQPHFIWFVLFTSRSFVILYSTAFFIHSFHLQTQQTITPGTKLSLAQNQDAVNLKKKVFAIKANKVSVTRIFKKADFFKIYIKRRK